MKRTIRLQTVNKEVVKTLPVEIDNRPVLGEAICKEPYANIFLCAKKKSGKTLTVAHILKKCAAKDTKIFVFASTFYKDKNWKAIQRMLDKKGIEYEGFTSMNEDGENILDEIIKPLRVEPEQEKEEEEEEVSSPDALLEQLLNEFQHGYNEQEDKKEKKERKSKYLAPKYIFVFDDLSNELKSPVFVKFLKENRHYLCKTIISSQYLCDLLPESRKQIDLWIIFKGQPADKLKEIYKDADLAIGEDLFLYLYKAATSKPFSFFYVDNRNDIFRMGFNREFKLPINIDEEEI
jgi:hypothetical protein